MRCFHFEPLIFCQCFKFLTSISGSQCYTEKRKFPIERIRFNNQRPTVPMTTILSKFLASEQLLEAHLKFTSPSHNRCGRESSYKGATAGKGRGPCPMPYHTSCLPQCLPSCHLPSLPLAFPWCLPAHHLCPGVTIPY